MQKVLVYAVPAEKPKGAAHGVLALAAGLLAIGASPRFRNPQFFSSPVDREAGDLVLCEAGAETIIRLYSHMPVLTVEAVDKGFALGLNGPPTKGAKVLTAEELESGEPLKAMAGKLVAADKAISPAASKEVAVLQARIAELEAAVSTERREKEALATQLQAANEKVVALETASATKGKK